MINRSMLLALTFLAATASVNAQSSRSADGISAAPTYATQGDPRSVTLMQLMRPISTELENARLEDVIQFVSDFTGARIEPIWYDDATGVGLDPDFEVTISISNAESLTFLERIIEKAQEDEFIQNTWQLTEDGALEIGPKSALNKRKSLVVYDINDLLFEIPNFQNVPTLDLDSILDQGEQGGGGGGSSFFEDDQEQDGTSGRTREEMARDVMDLIMEFVESEQWIDNGGDGASMRFYEGTLLIKAPDYIHRQINGYDFWSSSAASGRAAGRYLTFGMGAQSSDVTFRNDRTYGGVGGGQSGSSGN